MPVFSDGQKISAALAWDRMIQSVPASYVVWKDGSTYRAECLLKGGTDYSGTDATTVINNAISSLTNGGKIFVKAGKYICNSPINVTTVRTVTIEGESLGVFAPTWDEGTILYKNFNGTLIDANYDSSSYHHALNLRNLVLVGKNTGYYSDYASGGAIEISYAKNFKWENVRVYRFESGIKMEHVGAHRLENVEASECKQYGFFINDVWDTLWENIESNCNQQDAGYAALYINNSNIMCNRAHLEGYRALQRGSDGFVHFNNLFIPWAKERAVYLEGRTAFCNAYLYGGNAENDFSGEQAATIWAKAAGIIEITNSYIDLSTSNSAYSIYTDTTGAGTVYYLSNNRFEKPVKLHNSAIVIGNHFLSDFTAYTFTTFDNNVVEGNVSIASRYKNSGTATIASGDTSVTFAHGLAGTPTIVTLGATHSEVADAYVSAKDATNITITVPNAVSADRDISWYAEYTP